jgi:zinc/manganese transport system substrate-binding protein
LLRGCILLLAVLCASVAEAADPPLVCSTTTDLSSLAREVGGDRLRIETFARGTEDVHFVEARPSFVRTLHDCELLLLNGLELEAGWLPPLLRSARNPRVQPGGSGYLDASSAIDPTDVPAGPVDRSMGDVHPFGNPHYLLDPVNGMRVARAIAVRLGELRPEARTRFESAAAALERRLGQALVGSELAERYDPKKLAALHAHGRLEAFLVEQGHEDRLRGWLGRLRVAQGELFVSYHRQWSDFAERFGLVFVAALEPKPGVPPSTRHLREVIETMRARRVKLILDAAYASPAPARLVAAETGARLAHMAHQVGAVPGTESYESMVEHNVSEVERALSGG